MTSSSPVSSKASTSLLRAVILDMDGVIWRADQPIGDLPKIFAEFDRWGWRVILATNNATLTVEQYLSRLAGFGVELEPWQVINSSQASAHYLKRLHPEGGPVFIVGEEGLRRDLTGQGFYLDEENPLAVVVSMDRQVNYEKLTQATLLIRSGVPFLATNTDRTFPTPAGLVPGAGAIVAAIEAATDVKPYVVGKPGPDMYKVAMDRLGTTPEATLVVGDRLETDIAGGQILGAPTALVLSGVTSATEAQAWQPQPTFIARDLTDLLEKLQTA